MTLLANDTFSDTHPKNLTAHTSDSGHTWSNAPGNANTLIIDAYGLATGVATAANNGSTGEALISCVPGTADYTVSVDVVVDGGNTADFPGVILRGSNSVDTCYRAYLNNLAGAGKAQVNVDKIIAGSFTAIGNTAGNIVIHNGDTCRITLDVSGTTLTATLLNVTTTATENANFTDSSIASIGHAGILHQFQTGGPHQVITAFALNGTAAGGSSIVIARRRLHRLHH